jgi:uncharacterized protein (DUF2252 family)
MARMTGDEATRAARPSLAERLESGRAVRRRTPRRDLAQLTTTGRDPLAILDEQDASRVPQMLPLRHERMAASPFAFYRGTAAVMAADFARDPHTGISVGSCGDAHVANFGFYASPQRTLLFDLNDFDEAAWAPWEWDLKRLVTSIVIAGRATDRSADVVDSAAHRAVRTYTRAIARAASTSPLERYWAHFDAKASKGAIDKVSRRVLIKAVRAARKRTGDRAVRKMTETGPDGRLQLIVTPPAMFHLDAALEADAEERLRAYATTAGVDIQLLLLHYSMSDTAFRAVGVGSVGTRCYVTVMEDGDGNALLLQTKEAQQSVLIRYGGAKQPRRAVEHIERFGEGGRVVGMQRVLQAISDPFLGHASDANGDYYIRQFRDMKGGIDTATLQDDPFIRYGEACAVTLARAHGQTADAGRVAGYIGRGEAVAEAVVAWANAYADLSYEDWTQFVARRHD